MSTAFKYALFQNPMVYLRVYFICILSYFFFFFIIVCSYLLGFACVNLFLLTASYWLYCCCVLLFLNDVSFNL